MQLEPIQTPSFFFVLLYVKTKLLGQGVKKPVGL